MPSVTCEALDIIHDGAAATRTVILAFAFSLRPDGAPGRSNTKTAHILRELLISKEWHDHLCRPWVGVQWEIYDALAHNGYRDENILPESQVAAPPLLTNDDLGDPVAVLDMLRRASTPAERILWRQLCRELRLRPGPGSASPSALARQIPPALARLVESPDFYQHFESVVELSDLHRSHLGLLGLEKRRMPSRAMYPMGLGHFQLRRVNRLIVEAIIPATLLRRGAYLNTRMVAEALISRAKADGREVAQVLVFSHPASGSRTREITLSVLRASGSHIDDENVRLADVSMWSDDELWDREAAQVWCRSAANWRAYAQQQTIGLERV